MLLVVFEVGMFWESIISDIQTVKYHVWSSVQVPDRIIHTDLSSSEEFLYVQMTSKSINSLYFHWTIKINLNFTFTDRIELNCIKSFLRLRPFLQTTFYREFAISRSLSGFWFNLRHIISDKELSTGKCLISWFLYSIKIIEVFICWV